jgi:hypothetical protein
VVAAIISSGEVGGIVQSLQYHNVVFTQLDEQHNVASFFEFFGRFDVVATADNQVSCQLPDSGEKSDSYSMSVEFTLKSPFMTIPPSLPFIGQKWHLLGNRPMNLFYILCNSGELGYFLITWRSPRFQCHLEVMTVALG